MKMIFEFDNIEDAVIEITDTDEKIEDAFLKLILRICNIAFEKDWTKVKDEEEVKDDL